MDGIDWTQIEHFRRDDFPEDPDLYAEADLIYTLDKQRVLNGDPIWPSPVPGALARLEGSGGSRHYAVGRRSDAVDVFPGGVPAYYWLMAVSSGLWGAVGFYPDTEFQGRSWPMLHLDRRPYGKGHGKDMPLLWIKDKKGYRYIQYDDAARAAIYDRLMEASYG